MKKFKISSSRYPQEIKPMATPEQIVEVRTKLTALVTNDFRGDFVRAFQGYANSQGSIDAKGLKVLLTDAGIGNLLTRKLWVAGILKELDTNKDGEISLDELKKVL